LLILRWQQQNHNKQQHQARDTQCRAYRAGLAHSKWFPTAGAAEFFEPKSRVF
jgi:hypothetical protein